MPIREFGFFWIGFSKSERCRQGQNAVESCLLVAEHDEVVAEKAAVTPTN